MHFYREIQRCFRLLLLHRLRSFLSTLGVLFGVVAVIAMLSIGEGAKQETLEQIAQLGMNSIIVRQHAMSDEQRQQAFEQKSHGLTWQDVEMLHQVPGLLHISPLKIVEASITGSSIQFTPEVLGVTRAFGEMKGLQLNEGRFLCDLDQKEKRLVCVLGYDVAKNFGQEGHLGRSLRLNNMHYEIVGVLKSTQWKESKNQSITTRNLDKGIFIPLQEASPPSFSSSSKQNDISEIVLNMHNFETLKFAIPLVRNMLEHLHGGYENYQIVVPQELLQQAHRTQKTFNLVLGSIAGISLLVGGIGIMNIMLANVSERTREIGIRRAVGASKRHILIQFLLETLLLTLVGALLGIFLGIGFSMAIGVAAGWRTVVTPWSIILSLLMSIGVGLGSGLYPAYQAAIMDPIRALRHD